MNNSPSPSPSTTRREFTGHTLQALLAVSLLEHLNAADLFAAKAKLTARQWLNEVNEIGHAVKGNQLKGVAWQKKWKTCWPIALSWRRCSS